MVEEEAEVGLCDGVIQVGIIEDNVGGLAAELEGHALEVGLAGRALNDLAHLGGARERNLCRCVLYVSVRVRACV